MNRILVSDRDPASRELECLLLSGAGFEVCAAETPERALELLAEVDVDLVVSGEPELLEPVRRQRPSLPVVLVADVAPADPAALLALAADGCVVRPLTDGRLEASVERALSRSFRSAVELRERMLTPTLAALGNAIEARDASLHGHCERVAALAARLGVELELDPDEVETLRLGAVLHDIGKVGIPERILLKPGAFVSEELIYMRTHPLIGDRILERLELLQSVRPIVRHHHEAWDGSGYPDGLAGEQIPVAARILGVADAVEAMSAARTYRRPLDREAIVDQLLSGRGTQWDPTIVDVALALIEAGDLEFGAEGLRLLEGRRRRPASKFSVLLIDEDSEEATLAKRTLEREIDQLSVSHAPDLATAMKLCGEGRSWSAVLLGNELPDANRRVLLEALRAAAPLTPVVLLAGDPSEANGVYSFPAGASETVIQRDAFLSELTDRVRSLLPA